MTRAATTQKTSPGNEGSNERGDMRMLRRMRPYGGYISHGFLAGTRGQFI